MSEAPNAGAESAATTDFAAFEATTDAPPAAGAAPAADDTAGNPANEPPESAAGADDDAADGKAKKSPTEERIGELTRKRHEAERRAAYWEGVAKGQPQGQQQEQRQQQQHDEDPEPDPTDTTKYQYGDTDPQYFKDVGAWSARQEHRRLTQQDRQVTTRQQIDQAYDARAAEFAKTAPDFAALTGDDDLQISPVMAHAIKTSDAGPAVAYHLAKNPDEARRISGLHPLAQAREIGAIEGRLAPASAPPVKTASDAPPPPTQIRGAGGKFATPSDTQDFAAFEKMVDAKS